MASGLLYAKEVPINGTISVTVPEVGEVMADEDGYYQAVSVFTATPYDLMVQLDDAGIDFSTLSEYGLFLLLVGSLRTTDCTRVFGGVDTTTFAPVATPGGSLDDIRVVNKDGVTIDKAAYEQIGTVLRRINDFEKTNKKPGNEAARKYMIERARVKQKRAAKKPKRSQLEDLIVAMVNTEQFHYGFEDVAHLSLYQFNASVAQVIKKVNYDHLMHGCYAGTIDIKNIDQSQLDWLKPPLST